jgi:hypothetical protein
MNAKSISLNTGIGVIIITHLYVLYAGIPKLQMDAHAYINLGAVGLILYGTM